MAGKKMEPRRFRLPRRSVLAAAGGIFLLLLTASGAGAYFMGGADLLLGNTEKVYGIECRLIDSVSFDHGEGERWVRQFIAIGETDPAGRLRTALRVAEHAARSERADLVLVVAVDAKGPTARPLMRGHAVGARVLYAPHPARVRDVDVPISASYSDAGPTVAGEFYGKLRKPPLARLETMMAAMKAPFGCKMPEPAEKTGGKHAGPEKKPAHGA